MSDRHDLRSGFAGRTPRLHSRAEVVVVEGVPLGVLGGQPGAVVERLGGAPLLLGAVAVRDGVGAPLPKAERGDVDRVEAAVLAALGETGLVAALARGRRLDPEQAVAPLLD